MAWDESKHPRVPKGSPSGGEFTSKGSTQSTSKAEKLKEARGIYDSDSYSMPFTGRANELVKWAKENGVELPLFPDGSLNVEKLTFISGAITGAVDPESERGLEHAERYYNEIRHRKDDVVSISRNTGIPEDVILKVKNYLFYDKQVLSDGTVRRFDADCYIAHSWQRLTEGKAIEADLLLLRHEIMELSLVNQGYSQSEAHDITNRSYNYTKAIKEYYEGKKWLY